MSKNKFQKGEQVNFYYVNSCNERVNAYGTVQDYDRKFYLISIGDDMPLIRVYCNQVRQSNRTDSFITPSKKSKTVLIKDKEVLSIPNYYNELKSILRQLRIITVGIGLIGCVLATIMYIIK